MLSVLRNRIENTDFWNLLQNTSFFRLFTGRVITDTGDSLYFIGAMWLVWELTGSPFYTGLAGALVRIPDALTFLIGPFVDRWELRPILFITQIINGIGVLTVPVAAAMGQLSVWLILVLMPVLAFVNGFVYPAQNVALPRIVEKDQLTRANSLFSTSIRTVDAVANAVAGVLIAVIGAVALFVVNGGTFAIAAVLFFGVTVPDATNRNADQEGGDGSIEDANDLDEGYFAELREGLDYVRGSVLLAILLGMMFVNFAWMAAYAVLPAFADSLGGPAVYGLLMAAIGGGMVVGTGGAFLVEDHSVSRVVIIGFPLSGLSWLAAIAVPGVWVTTALLFTAAISVGVFNVLIFSLLQSAVDNALLGRVSSLRNTLVAVMSPIGALLGGIVAGIIGSEMVMYGLGGVLVILGFYFFVHPGLRSLPPITEADEVALGLRSSAESADVAE